MEGELEMADCVDFGIIQSIDPNKDYSLIDGPEDYKKLYIQYQCVSISDDFVNELIPLPQMCRLICVHCKTALEVLTTTGLHYFIRNL